MEKAGNTASLRSMAPHWSLAGDKQLLNALQDIHQKIITRCQETNTRLEEMITSLDGANIDMQNVNNRFMALSTRQFVESRVYDDDVDVTTENPQKHEKSTIQPEPESDLAKLKQSLKILESMHESVRILDSDSGSDTDDDDGRMVYKPKDLYTQRPLPHIIGSYAWKNKWHAGIIPEDSDTDSSISKPGDDAMLEQYSESESEQTDTRTDKLHPPPRTISSSSSVVDSEPSGPAAPVSQADIAAELARKLGGNLPEIPQTSAEPEFTSPEPAQKKIYKPQKPETSTIFFDEPPPLEQTYQSDKEENNYDEDDDIFAELHRKKPSFSTANDQSRVNEDLFGGLNHSRDVVDDLFGIDKNNLSVSNKSEQNIEQSSEAEKKPIGGISLFGSIKGTESIAAAILKRNQRKSYSSDEESGNEVYNSKQNLSKDTKGTTSESSENAIKENKLAIKNKSNETEIERKTTLKPEKDVLRDIFDKNKKSKLSIENNLTKQDPVAKDNNKIDLFSDNIFDDVDNIFMDNVVRAPIKEADKNVKSIFDDDDDDDLFADIAITQHKTSNSEGTHNKVKVLFDSDNDDDLFSDTRNKAFVQQAASIKSENINPGSSAIMISNKETKSLFDDSDDDIFFNVKSSSSNINEVNLNESKQEKEPVNSVDITKDTNLSKDDDNNNLFSRNSFMESSELGNNTEGNTITVNIKSEQINNKCSGEGYINSTYTDNHNVSLTPNLNSTCQNRECGPALFGHEEPDDLCNPHLNSNIECSPALFDDEEADDLFNNKSKKENEFGSTYLNCEKENESRNNTNTMNVESLNNKNEGIHTLPNIHIIGSINITKSENKSDMSEIVTSAQSKPKDDISPITVQKPHNDNLGVSNKNDTFDDNISNSPLPQSPLFYKPDIFSDIFNDVPPDFEKPKEPKKSKNVNALFDDDSDDEALFFKKDDNISDEKPDLSSPAKHDSLFRIFSDEPPAIDVNVTQKNNDVQSTEYEEYKKLDLKDLDDSFIHPIQNEINDHKKQRNLQQKETDLIDDLTEKVINTENIKSIGKLKGMNLNINVNTLLPGASPKKYKLIEESYEQNISTKNIDTNSLMKNTESKLEKSVSFEDDANSELLDNKFSKERAKIQVKRRPSTRRARREAVKNSEIDFGSKNSTDNTSSVGKPVATPDEKVERTVVYHTDEKSSKVKDVKSKIVYILNDEDIFSNVNSDESVSQISKTSVLNKLENQQHFKSNTILNFDDGDDLFRNVKVPKAESSAVVNSYEKVEISNNMISNLSSVTNVVAQRKVDKENSNVSIKAEANIDKPNKTKMSIFDDMSDEERELFLSKKPIVSKTKNIFGSESDEELFASKKSTEQLEDKLKPTTVKVEVKKSLFDDDSDDELFGGKKSSTGSNPLFSKAKEEKPSHTQSVIEDPLSMVTDDNFNNDV
ncbi:unnamed protein product [Parnassius apollo]|uniref:(apollo) hypothetical protein n=1 Tax=Parnassius apollo TaxID=110799 RepID=A0A8S3W9W6_PARAO|nr:unnamed protein product [Parnassius apollo]